MYDWYSEYTRTISSDIGDKGFSKEIRIDYINQNTIYAFNEYSKAQIKSISVDGNECELVDSNNNFSKGTIQISFDESCTQNLNSNINEVVVVSDKGTYSTLLSISNSNYVFSNDDDSKDSNGGSEAIINYCPSGSFTYENVLFDYLDIEDGLTKNIVKVDSISGGSKTSYINITCNYPSIDYDSDSFRSSIVCDTGYLLNSLEDSCELITSCSSGDYSFNGELFSYPFLDSGSTYTSTISETNNEEGSILSKNLGLLCENTIVSNTSYEEVLGCLDGYELISGGEFLESKITARDGIKDDYFGSSISIYENTLVVGARLDDHGVTNSGSVYIFEKDSDGIWIQIQKITARDGASGDYFGSSVSIYKNTLVVGAYGDDDKGSDSGSAYIFEINSDGAFEQIQKITAGYQSKDDRFGGSVSIYEDTIIVGAYKYDANRGSAYIFERNSNRVWNQKQRIIGGAQGNYFGISVSIYEDTVLIGENLYLDNNKNSRIGSANIYEKNSNGEFEEIQKIIASDGAAGDRFGGSVSIYEDTLVVGANYDDNKDSDSGASYIFEKNSNGEFKQIQKIIASDGAAGDRFGGSVSIYEDTMVITASGDDDKGTDSGSTYIFEKISNGDWHQKEKIIASDGAAGDGFGGSVSIYEDTLVITAPRDDDKGSSSGSTYIFEIGTEEPYCKLEQTSCKEILENNPNSESGLYTINPTGLDEFEVYCDMETDGGGFTLIESFSLENKDAYKRKPFFEDFPRNENTPENFEDFRFSLSKIEDLVDVSTEVRVGCNMEINPSKDYVFFDLSELNILTFNALGDYKKINKINIRGNNYENKNLKWWHGGSTSNHLHTDGYHNNIPNSIYEEDIFGWYTNNNPSFSCTSSQSSTTNWYLR